MTAGLPVDSLAFALRHAADAIAVVIGGRNLDLALAGLKVPAASRPAIQDLAYGALRRYGRSDFLLGKLLSRPLQEARIRGLLLAALYRLEARPEDAHTTVDQAVHAAGGIAGGRYRPLTNGVLRNFLRQQDALLAALADQRGAARWQHPDWWIAALRTAFPEQWQQALEAGNGHPPMTLRVNRRHGDAATYLARLSAAGIGARQLDDSAIMLDKPQAVDRLPGFFDGHASVQDWGAQRAAALLDARDGMRVLDACAAPGGKTAHLLERTDLELLALDAAAERATRIDDNLRRLNLKATVQVADCARLDQWWDGRPFDRILADVPCSASGVVRRHPDAKWLRRPEDVASFATTQARIMDALWRALAPGGRMLYCTCSVFPEENAQQTVAFLGRHPDAGRIPLSDGSEELQLIPGPDHDGFFYALLAKHPA